MNATMERLLAKIDARDDNSADSALSSKRSVPHLSHTENRSATQSELEQYVDAVLEMLAAGTAKGRSSSKLELSFHQALTLENRRIRLNVSPSQRDAAIANIVKAAETERRGGSVPEAATFDPMSHIRFKNPQRLADEYEQREVELSKRQGALTNLCHVQGCSEKLQSGWFSKVFGNKSPSRSSSTDPDGSAEIVLATKQGGTRCAYCGYRFCAQHISASLVRIVEFAWIDSASQRTKVCVRCVRMIEACEVLLDSVSAAVRERQRQQQLPQGHVAGPRLALLRSEAAHSQAEWLRAMPSPSSPEPPVTLLSSAPRGRLLYDVPSRVRIQIPFDFGFLRC
jgi:hypothetical protein